MAMRGNGNADASKNLRVNTAARSLNHAKAALPRVFSLHTPDGHVTVIFSSPDPAVIVHTLTVWGAYLERDYVAIEWRDGEPYSAIA